MTTTVRGYSPSGVTWTYECSTDEEALVLTCLPNVPAGLTPDDHVWLARHLELAGADRQYPEPPRGWPRVGPAFIDPSVVMAG